MNAHIAADRMHSMPLCHIDFMLINDNLMRTLCAPSTASPFRTNNRHFENSRSTEYNEPRRRRRWMRSAQKQTNETLHNTTCNHTNQFSNLDYAINLSFAQFSNAELKRQPSAQATPSSFITYSIASVLIFFLLFRCESSIYLKC